LFCFAKEEIMGRGQAPAKAIPMTTLQFTLLQEEGNKRTTQQQFSTRICLLLKASQGHSNSQIARDLSLSLNTVKSWRRRWQNSYVQLCKYESNMQDQGLSRHNYLQVLLNELRDLPRSGTRKQISMEEEEQIVALASEEPQDYGVEMSSWTHEMLAKVAIARGIVQKISSRHVGNILKKRNCNRTSRNTGYSQGSKTGKHSL
jgi:transposase